MALGMWSEVYTRGVMNRNGKYACDTSKKNPNQKIISSHEGLLRKTLHLCLSLSLSAAEAATSRFIPHGGRAIETNSTDY